MSTILINLQAVQQQIIHAAQIAGRSPHEIQLLAVSKTFNAEAVLEAGKAGQTAFGENYLQEALDKMAEVRRLSPELALEWHFIGPIQSNKTRLIAQNFSWAHAVDRLKIAERLSEQRPDNLPPLNICLQINISEQETKSGVPINQAAQLAQQIAALPNVRLRGLMAIPEPAQTLEQQRTPYQQIKTLQEQLNQQGLALDTLSMGMSADLEAAILEGSTMVRIGSAIFGKRNYA
ncbi:YggS family pyridoxal phosphate-dependent enzyme [Solimicrobium silvestre]|uniref:Pyridoxal phosphate homeostasis protein n=1 Tax=Solimicrobium silvestre TaxID=2099400 RepID=A0A2S9H3A9_9BURK|nr:YggS family pyridoxal phosphate-dependent enzyme [Solimicrobium silvestre]PRC94423.1 pyridoxal phosphate enzyme [Solimicrobium silvestre]